MPSVCVRRTVISSTVPKRSWSQGLTGSIPSGFPYRRIIIGNQHVIIPATGDKPSRRRAAVLPAASRIRVCSRPAIKTMVQSERSWPLLPWSVAQSWFRVPVDSGPHSWGICVSDPLPLSAFPMSRRPWRADRIAVSSSRHPSGFSTASAWTMPAASGRAPAMVSIAMRRTAGCWAKSSSAAPSSISASAAPSATYFTCARRRRFSAFRYGCAGSIPSQS